MGGKGSLPMVSGIVHPTDHGLGRGKAAMDG